MSFLRSTMKNVPILVHVTDVTGEETAIDERLGGLLRPVPVTAHDVGSLDADLAGFAHGDTRCGIVERHHIDIDAGQRNPHDPGLPGSTIGCVAAAGDVSVMPIPLRNRLPVSASKRCSTSSRQGGAAGAAITNEDRSRFSMPALQSAIHMVGTPFEVGRALDFDIAERLLNVEFRAQEYFIAIRQMPQHDRGHRKNVK